MSLLKVLLSAVLDALKESDSSLKMYDPGRPARHRPHEEEGKQPPSSPGAYRIVDRKGDVAYVGETNDLRRRENEHVASGKLKPGEAYDWKVADGRSTSKTRREHEREAIKKHEPPRNSSRGGEGRKAKR